ncbi:MAG: hypothetical protein JST73_00535 [Actinobacteria bacterium]|nr:hypothetical protein [Actinomycetota bacterium]
MTEPRPIRLVFWNTFLLSPHPVPGGPALPAIGDLAAPAVAERATAIGRALGERFDIAALAEAFEVPDHRRILDAWGSDSLTSASGPGRSLRRGAFGFASSGLFSVVDSLPLVRSESLQYRTRGSYRWDADALANKGALLIEVELPDGRGNLEVVSTHLIFGTGLLSGPQARDKRRRHGLRMEQLGELVTFIEAVHRSENALAVVGDFNVPAVDPAFPDGADAQYRDLVARLEPLGVADVWPSHGSGPGPTCGSPLDDFVDQRDPDDPMALVDPGDTDGRFVAPGLVAQRERIDHVFFGPGTTNPDLAVTSARRYAFPRPEGSTARNRLVRLSDHCAIGVDLV